MISIARLPDTLVDWDSWTAPLQQFAQASGLTVSAYDAAGERKLGPLPAGATAQLLGASTLWHEDGPGTAFERELVARCVAGDQADSTFHGLRVCTLPLTLLGQTYGAIVYGWRFDDFASPMACEQIARQIGIDGQALWQEVRQEAPLTGARLATYRALLATLAGTIDRQRENIEELQRLSRARDLFLATVSHEMRTPLSALSLRLELMLRTVKNLPPQVESGLMAMRMHVRQEASMIDDLIDAARTLTGQMSIVRTPVSLGRVVRDAIATIEVAAQQKAIALTVIPSDHGDGIHMAADGRRLQQVLWNLLLNAIKFTPTGGSIEVRVNALPDSVLIDVVDSGQGIGELDLPHVFGPFNLQTQSNATGLGLGLYIARRIVELHGGNLSAASAGRGRGTTFTIRLPRNENLTIA